MSIFWYAMSFAMLFIVYYVAGALIVPGKWYALPVALATVGAISFVFYRALLAFAEKGPRNE